MLSSVNDVGFDVLDNQTSGEEFVGEVRICETPNTNDKTVLLPRAQRNKKARYMIETVDKRKEMKQIDKWSLEREQYSRDFPTCAISTKH